MLGELAYHRVLLDHPNDLHFSAAVVTPFPSVLIKLLC
jgi:hypothetical protein